VQLMLSQSSDVTPNDVVIRDVAFGWEFTGVSLLIDSRWGCNVRLFMDMTLSHPINWHWRH
jgi:hypothetical protein